MQIPPRELRRRIVPRWRSILRTPVEELENHCKQGPVDSSVIHELQRRVEQWEGQKTSEAAQELLWAASVFGHHTATTKALRAMADSGDLPEPIRDSARDLVAEKVITRSELPIQLDTRKFLQERIHALKERILIAPHDPVQYIELARFYSRLGQSDQAKRSITIACGLAPSARFILRAATRCLVHIEDYDCAIKILERGNPADPWIQAARISVSDLGGRPVPDVKRARATLESDVHPKHLSELAGSLATVEHGSGNISRSKRLFRQCAIDPNDNAIAQLLWASQNRIIEFKPELLERSLTFEARTAFARREKRWTDALLHCADWMQDEPFSLRPATVGSFVAAEILQDYDKSIEFCETGLIANPDNFVLLNNLAFCHTAKGNIETGADFLKAAQSEIRTKMDEIIFLATSGMISFRKGQQDVGVSNYTRAIDLALAAGLSEIAQLATVHYLAEVANSGSFFSMQEIEQISTMMQSKQILPEVRDIYSARLKPLLAEHHKQPGPRGAIQTSIPQLFTD